MANPVKNKIIPKLSYDLLLVAILLLLLATPFLEKEHRTFLAISMALVFFAGAYATRFKRWHLVVSGVLGGAWLILTLLGFLATEGPGQLAALGLFVLFAFYTAAVIITHVVRSEEVTRTLISGGVSVYFLLGIGFAVIFAMVQSVSPGAIFFPEGEALTFSSFIYFSIASITTVGYGDVYPVSGPARILAVLEAAIGFLYIGVFIARLIGQFRTGKNKGAA